MLKNLENKRILCYPNFSPELAKRIELKLIKAGVKSLISFGKYEIGKGTNSIVIKGKFDEKEVAIKIIRTDSSRKTLLHEANILRAVNQYGIGPKLYSYSKYFLVLEYIEGIYIDNFIEESKISLIKNVIKGLLNQCRILDKIGIDHGELSRPMKHVIITKNLEAKIIDFESSSKKRNCKNVTSILSYLFFVNRRIKSLINDNEFYSYLIEVLSNYKREKSEKNFKELIELIETYL